MQDKEGYLSNFIIEQNQISKIIKDLKLILTEGISKAKILTYSKSNKNEEKTFKNIENNNNNKTLLPEAELLKSKKIETVLRFCALIDNSNAAITKFLTQKNKNNFKNVTKKTSTVTILNAANLNFYESEKIEILNKNLKASFLSAGVPSGISNFNNLNTQINDDAFGLALLESFQRKSAYKSLFKNCKNTLNEIIKVYKNRPRDSIEVKSPQRAISPIVNNLTNNYNFNFNFNVPNVNNSLSRSQEYKKNSSNVKKEKASFFKSLKTNNNKNEKMQFYNSERVNIKNENDIKSIDNSNNKVENDRTLDSNKTLKSNFFSDNYEMPKEKSSMNSVFTDYSVFDEKKDCVNTLKIASFVKKPKNFFSSKNLKLIEFNNTKQYQNSILLGSLKKRAKSLNENYWEQYNYNGISNNFCNNINKMLLSKSSKSDFINSLVNEEIIDSINLPISKIRNVNLETYNKKGSKMYVAKYVNLSSKKIFKLLCNKNGKAKESDEAELTFINLNNSCEFDASNSHNLFTNCFKNDKNLNNDFTGNYYNNIDSIKIDKKSENFIYNKRSILNNKTVDDKEITISNDFPLVNSTNVNKIDKINDNSNIDFEKRNNFNGKSDANFDLEKLNKQYSNLILNENYKDNIDNFSVKK